MKLNVVFEVVAGCTDLLDLFAPWWVSVACLLGCLPWVKSVRFTEAGRQAGRPAVTSGSREEGGDCVVEALGLNIIITTLPALVVEDEDGALERNVLVWLTCGSFTPQNMLAAVDIHFYPFAFKQAWSTPHHSHVHSCMQSKQCCCVDINLH